MEINVIRWNCLKHFDSTLPCHRRHRFEFTNYNSVQVKLDKNNKMMVCDPIIIRGEWWPMVTSNTRTYKWYFFFLFDYDERQTCARAHRNHTSKADFKLKLQWNPIEAAHIDFASFLLFFPLVLLLCSIFLMTVAANRNVAHNTNTNIIICNNFWL